MLTCFLFLFKIESLISQPIPEKRNYALIHKQTATWCKYCGSWGWELQDSLEKNYKDIALVISLHANNSGLQNTLTKAWNDNFSVSNSIPCWYANGIDQTKWSSGNVYGYKIRENIKMEVNKFSSATVVASSSFKYNFNGDSISVISNVKFFQNTTGEYYLGVYLFEDSVLFKQTTLNGEEIKSHNNLLRYSLNDSPFGSQIFDGTIQNNAVYKLQFPNYYIDPKKVISKYSYLASIIWKKVNGKYLFVNSNKLTGYLNRTLTDVSDNKVDENIVKLQSNPLDNIITLEFNAKESFINSNVSIFNLNGEMLVYEKLNIIYPGTNIHEIKTDVLSQGIYLINVCINGVVTRFEILKIN